MQQDINRLSDSISIQTGLVSDLLRLALEKRQAIILGNLNELNEIMRRENQLVRSLQMAETQRQGAALDVARQLGIEESKLTASLLVDALQRIGVVDSRRLSEEVEELAFNLDRLKEVNQANAELLEQSLAFIESVEALLTRQRETTYSAGGSVKDGPARSVLDKRI